MAPIQEQNKKVDIGFYIALLLRRKWEIILGMIPVLICGIIYCLYTPKIYSTSTTIILIPQQIPTNYVRPTVTGNMQARVRTIWQEITSRTNLERIIQQFNLYPDLRQQLPMESVVEFMRDRIKITSPRRARNNAFILSFQGENPTVIAKVANALANMFIEQNLKLRQQQAQTTTGFLEQQLQQVAQQLKEKEDALRKYKMKYMGELPSQQNANLAMLQRLQNQLTDVNQNINGAQGRLLLLERQLTEEEERVKKELSTLGTNSTNSNPTTLEGLYAKLKALKTKYTDLYPDVIAVKKQIAEMKAKLKTANNKKNKATHSKNNNSEVISPSLSQNSVIVGLNYQIKNTKLEIKALRAEAAKLQQQIDIYNKRIEDTPKREEELIELTRGYNTVKKVYDSLLSRKIAAEQAQALEQLQEGEQFRVIDPARVPQQPIKPKLKKILILTLLASIAVGIGIAFLRDVMANVFYDVEEIEANLNLPVLACIPFIPSEQIKKKRRVKTICLIAITLMGYTFVAFLLFLLWKYGAGSLMTILHAAKYKILSRA